MVLNEMPAHNVNGLMLYDCLLASAEKSPEQVAIVADGQRYSYGQLLEASLRLAAWLHARGIKNGNRVVIFMENSWPCAVAVYGILIAGGTFVAINSQTKSEKLAFILNDCEARCLITDDNLSAVYIPAIKETNSLVGVLSAGLAKSIPDMNLVERFDEVISSSKPLEVSDDQGHEKLASIIYTSGSTGLPKGVMLSHRTMVFTTWSLIEYLKLSADDRILLLLPMAFDYGLYQLLMAVKLGATLILERSFTFPADVYNAIEANHITVFPAVPTVFATMINTHRKKRLYFPDVGRVTSTAANLQDDFIPILRDIFPNAMIYSMYGLTECKRVSYLEPELLDKKPGSVGKAIPGTEVFLLTEDGQPAKPGEEGILYVKGPHVMNGYWKNPKLTDYMLKDGQTPGEKVLCTHDRFKMDEDGFLYFISRTDDIIKSRGEKVCPLEVEKILLGIKGIVEAAVIGVEDPVQGSAICAFVVAEPDAGLNERKVKALCLNKLENYMVPHNVIFLDKLPKSENQKIDKQSLKNLVID